jgi:hypothetical protein
MREGVIMMPLRMRFLLRSANLALSIIDIPTPIAHIGPMGTAYNWHSEKEEKNTHTK